MDKLTFELLNICSPFYECNILGGWSGKNNVIEHVCLDRIPNDEHSLIVINDFSDTPQLIEEILTHDLTSGLLILTNGVNKIPPSYMNLANQYNKPLLVIKDKKTEEIIKKLTSIIFLWEHDVEYFFKNELSNYFLNLFFQDGIEQVMIRFQQIFGQEIYLLNNKMTHFPLPTDKYNEHDFHHLEVIERMNNNQVYILTNGLLQFYSLPVFNMKGQNICHLLFEKKQPIEDNQILFLKGFIPTVMSLMKQGDITKKAHALYRDQFLFDILYNNMETEREIIQLGHLHNMKFTSFPFVLSININTQQMITKSMIDEMMKILMKTNFLKMNIYSTYLNHRIVSIIFPEEEGNQLQKEEINQWIRKVQSEILEKYPNIQLLFGVGNAYHSFLNIYKSFQESKIALQMEMYGLGDNGIIHYEDTGFIRLLTYIHNDMLTEFANLYIGKLYDYDKENDTELVHTLTAFVNQNGDIIRTADTLYIHQNTLRQRLRKIENVLNMDLHNYNDLVNIILSIKISQEMSL